VLAAAITSFVRTGYHGATMRSIARLAGISVPGVYHHYAGKQELLVITLDLAMDDLTWRLLAAAREGTDGVGRVRLMVEALALFHTHRWELAFIGASEMRSLEPVNRRRIAELRNHVQHVLDDAIDAAIADGALHTPSPRHAGRAISTMCTSLPQWFHLGGPATPERIASEYAQFAIGLLAHPPAAEGAGRTGRPVRAGLTGMADNPPGPELRKRHGVHYTPPELAAFLAEPRGPGRWAHRVIDRSACSTPPAATARCSPRRGNGCGTPGTGSSWSGRTVIPPRWPARAGGSPSWA